MTDLNPLLDGTLSVKVAGVEYAAAAGALQFESVAPGGFGPASFEASHRPPSATGGVITEDGDDTVHTFTDDGTLACTGSIAGTVDGPRGGTCGAYGTGAAALAGSMAVDVAADAVNYCTNPRAVDANSDNKLDGTTWGSSVTGTPVFSCVGGVQRIQYTGVAGDSSDKSLNFRFATAAGSIVGGDPVTYSALLSGVNTGVTVKVALLNGDFTDIQRSAAITLTETPTRCLATGTVKAGQTVVYAYITLEGIRSGDVTDLSVTQFQIEKLANPGTDYFDGSSGTGCSWSGATDASTSVFTGTVVVSYLTEQIPSPFDIPATFPELVNGAAVVITHGATPVPLYEGSIVGDPTIAKLENGESLIAVECGGLLDKAKYRQDYGTTKVDTTYDNWARHRASDKGFSDTIDGMLRLDVNDGQVLTSGDIAGIFYRVNQGIVTSPDDEVLALDFEYDLSLVTVNAAWHCDIWAAPYYVDTLDPADWTTGLWAQSNTTAEGTAHVTGFPAGTRCVAFVSWVAGDGTSGAKRHAELTNLRVNCFDAASATPTVDQAMVDCGVVTGLATASDTETIGNPLAQCVVPPSTTHADGLDKLASMYEAPVDWGFWDAATLRVKKRLNSPADDVAIRALAGAGTAPAAYLLDATTPAFDYDVHKYEEGKFDYVRAIFTDSRSNRIGTPSPSGSTWPTDWWRSDEGGTNIVALSSRFKFLVAANVPRIQTPVVDGFSFLTPDTTSVGCRINLTATVPAGTTIEVAAFAVFLDSDEVLISSETVATTITGEVTAQDSILKGSFVVPAGTASVFYGVEATRVAGAGSSTLLFSPVDFHDQFPGGSLRTVCAPSDPPADASLKVGILDLTSRGDLTVDRAFAVATRALAWIDSTLETGTIVVFSPTVPIYGGGTKLAAYIRASDWVECAQVDGHAPLWISSSHVDVDEGVTTLTIEPYPFDVAESDFGHAHTSRLRRWKKARRGMYRRQKAALRKAQSKENRTKLGPGHKRRIHYI